MIYTLNTYSMITPEKITLRKMFKITVLCNIIEVYTSVYTKAFNAPI